MTKPEQALAALRRMLRIASPAPSATGPLTWHDDHSLSIGDIGFRLSHDSGELRSGSSQGETFLLGKPRHMVEFAAGLAAERPAGKLFEMGILQGGSVVLYDLVFSPEKLVAIDHAPNPVQPLAEYIRRHGKARTIRPCYGIGQDDREKMEKLLSREFPERDIDLVVDDASHYYRETRDAFNIVFPYLKPGGLYIIEDWAWAHWAGEYWQGADSPFKGRPALSNLLIELFMLSASRPDLIESLFVDHNMIVVAKGAGALPHGDFDLAEHYLMRGKSFEPIL